VAAAPDRRALSKELAMTLPETQLANLTEAARRPDDLAVAYAHFKTRVRAAVVRPREPSP